MTFNVLFFIISFLTTILIIFMAVGLYVTLYAILGFIEVSVTNYGLSHFVVGDTTPPPAG